MSVACSGLRPAAKMHISTCRGDGGSSSSPHMKAGSKAEFGKASRHTLDSPGGERAIQERTLWRVHHSRKGGPVLTWVATFQCSKLSCQAQLSCRSLTCCLGCQICWWHAWPKALNDQKQPNQSEQSQDMCCSPTPVTKPQQAQGAIPAEGCLGCRLSVARLRLERATRS